MTVPPPPPPPPPEATAPSPAAPDPELLAELEDMVTTVEGAIERLNAGELGLDDFQTECLDAGIRRVGGVAFIWDWVNGLMYGYDGMEVVVLDQDLPEPEGREA